MGGKLYWEVLSVLCSRGKIKLLNLEYYVKKPKAKIFFVSLHREQDTSEHNPAAAYMASKRRCDLMACLP